jgi:adenine phosphoribosyltransferase
VSTPLSERLKRGVEEVVDFPKPGVRYRDITPILQDPALFREVVDTLAEHYSDAGVDVVCGIESRGIIFGAALAYRLGLPIIPIRVEEKLPHEGRPSSAFGLEYGFDALAAHRDSLEGGKRVLLVDDLLATGATLSVCVDLVRKAGGSARDAAVVIEVTDFEGRSKVPGLEVLALCSL